MLFDLRGRSRRRVVKVVYIGLALLFGVGFIGFGVGVGSGGGGLLDALTNNSGSSGASFSAEIKKDRKAVAAQPNNPAPLANLIQDLLRQAGTGENYNNTEGAFTSKAQGLLHEARDNWQHYLAMNPSNPSSDVASEMLQVFGGPGGLNEPTAAVAALQIVIADRPPSEALYADLAEFSYKAGNTRQGDLASAKAVSLAPKTERGLLRAQLADVKKNPKGREGASSSSAASTAATSTASSGAASGGAASGGSINIGGKTYKIKPSTGAAGAGGTVTAGSATSKTSTSSSAPKKH
jgi:hypothetical protein